MRAKDVIVAKEFATLCRCVGVGGLSECVCLCHNEEHVTGITNARALTVCADVLPNMGRQWTTAARHNFHAYFVGA